MRRGPAIFLLVCLLFGAAYGAWRAGQEGFQRLRGFSPPHFTATRPTTGATPLAHRLVLVMVDGLRAEDAHLLPSLEWLRRRGASYRLAVPGPSYQISAAATLLSGAPPTLHGVMATQPENPLGSDHLLHAALRVRVAAGGAGSPALGRLVAGTATIWHEGEGMEQLTAGVVAMLKPDGPRLVVLQVTDLMTAVRRSGTADTRQADYRDGLANLDAHLTALFDQIDWRTTALMVTGTTPIDHRGRRAEGGQVPLLMAGPGIQAGARGEASLLDVAPTAAALLGLPAPMQAQGRPLLGALQVEGRPADALMQSYLTSRRALTAALLPSLQSAADPPEAVTTAAEADGYLEVLARQVKEARFEWAKAGILERLPYLGTSLLLLLIYLVMVYRQPFGAALATGHLVYAAAFHLLLFLAGGRYGPGLAGLDSPIGQLRLRFGLVAVAAMLLAVTAAGLLLARREFKRPSYLTTCSLHLSLSLSALLAAPVVAGLLLTGWEFPVDLPPVGLWVWFFLTALQVMVIAGLSPLWAWVGVRVVQAGHRLWPPKEIGDPAVNADKVVRLKALRRSSKVKG
ncbi:MAG: hypothetical protein ACOY93_19085 [Bacillota bacterium]